LALPLYEYRCRKCNHQFEKIEAVSSKPTKKCPRCGGRAERQIAAPAIQFKGSGWYVTDYAGKRPGAAAAEKSGDGATPAKSTESKAESSEKTEKAHAKKKH